MKRNAAKHPLPSALPDPEGFIDSETQVAGVIGYPIRHTLSPAMHNAAFRALGLNWIYLPFEVPPERLDGAIKGMRGLRLRGLNVTIPHKVEVIRYLDELTEAARRIGAVNTLFWEDSHLVGDNTDAGGFLQALRQAGFDAKGKRVLVVGAGGSARAVLYALSQQDAYLFLTNRSIEKARQLATEFAVEQVYPLEPYALHPVMNQIDLVIHCTPVGMAPEAEKEPPIPLEALPPHAWVSDLIYRPLHTRFLRRAASLGLHTLGGLEMLLYQGAESFVRWTGLVPPVEVMRRALLEQVDSE